VQGFNVHFVLGQYEGEFKSKLSSKVEIHNLNVKRFSTGLFALKSILKRVNPDAILSTLIYCNIITALAYKLSGIKSKLILREATTPSKDLSSKPNYFKTFYKITHRWAHNVVAVSEGVKKDIVSNFGLNSDKVIVIPNPIISKEILALSESNEALGFFDTDKKNIVTVGKVTPAKDYLTLLKAFKIVNKTIACNLIIVGKYFEKSQLYIELQEFIKEHSLSENVTFTGFRANPFEFMKRASVFVLSSIYEGSPGVLIQGLAINGNVVSTDCESGPKEILDNGKEGKLVPVGDFEAMAQSLIEAIETPKDRRNSNTLKNYFIENSLGLYKSVLFETKINK
jgi:glycosyltransferase involved in cell wall biosynthesis